MILTPHLLTGAAVASKISNPFLAIPLAILSHYFLDLMPHDEYPIANIQEERWDKSFFDFLKVSGDALIGILLISLFSSNDAVVFMGAFLAIMPDGITFLNKIYLRQNKLIILHQKLHIAVNLIGDRSKNKKITLFWGIFSQVIIAIIAIFVISR